MQNKDNLIIPGFNFIVIGLIFLAIFLCGYILFLITDFPSYIAVLSLFPGAFFTLIGCIEFLLYVTKNENKKSIYLNKWLYIGIRNGMLYIIQSGQNLTPNDYFKIRSIIAVMTGTNISNKEIYDHIKLLSQHPKSPNNGLKLCSHRTNLMIKEKILHACIIFYEQLNDNNTNKLLNISKQLGLKPEISKNIIQKLNILKLPNFSYEYAHFVLKNFIRRNKELLIHGMNCKQIQDLIYATWEQYQDDILGHNIHNEYISLPIEHIHNDSHIYLLEPPFTSQLNEAIYVAITIKKGSIYYLTLELSNNHETEPDMVFCEWDLDDDTHLLIDSVGLIGKSKFLERVLDRIAKY